MLTRRLLITGGKTKLETDLRKEMIFDLIKVLRKEGA